MLICIPPNLSSYTILVNNAPGAPKLLVQTVKTNHTSQYSQFLHGKTKSQSTYSVKNTAYLIITRTRIFVYNVNNNEDIK